jgi:hypothetical protein
VESLAAALEHPLVGKPQRFQEVRGRPLEDESAFKLAVYIQARQLDFVPTLE